MNRTDDIFICACHSTEHQLVVSVVSNDDGSDADAWISVHLAPLPFHKRLVYAVKYLFGHKSSSGAFAEFGLNKENSERLHKQFGKVKKLVTY